MISNKLINFQRVTLSLLLLAAFQSIPHVEELILDGSEINTSDLLFFQCFSNLQTASLRGCNIPSEAEDAILQSLFPFLFNQSISYNEKDSHLFC